MTSYIDTHIHLDRLAAPAAMLAEAEQAGVATWIVPGIAPERWPQVMATTGLHPGVFAAPGIHPLASGGFRPGHLETLRDLLAHPKAVALGEVGLDRQVAVPWQAQEEVFIAMIRLAREMDKPLLIHARRATERILELLHREDARRVGGIVHAFSGSLETAGKIIDLGFALGIGGVLTFATARRLPEVVRQVPAEALLLETDAPDMAPEPHRGQPNRPAHLLLVAEKLAALRGWTPAEAAATTTANARRVLRLDSR